MEFIYQHIGEIAGGISFLAYIKYIVSIFQGKTKPSRSTWWILTFVGILILFSSNFIGAIENMWIQLSYIIGPLIIAILSIFPRYGYSTGLLKIDQICLLGGILCIGLWIVFNSPMVAFVGSIIVDFIGLIPTIKKAYFDPNKEDLVAWGITMIAVIINAVGISVWFSMVDKDWIYASYLLLTDGLITVFLWRKSNFKLI